jgi:UPF0042 nucleotide-binding protein
MYTALAMDAEMQKRGMKATFRATGQTGILITGDGIPLDADLVFDVRCLPNPHYDPKLRPLTGRDEPVRLYFGERPIVGEMLDDIERFLDRWLPSYMIEQRSYLTVSIGCTGGQHRSVFCVEALADRFRSRETVLVRHRGIEMRAVSPITSTQAA